MPNFSLKNLPCHRAWMWVGNLFLEAFANKFRLYSYCHKMTPCGNATFGRGVVVGVEIALQAWDCSDC